MAAKRMVKANKVDGGANMARAARAAVKITGTGALASLWIWNWVGGGYHSCRAESREGALAIANVMAGDSTLQVDVKTLHVGTTAELDALRAHYAGMCD